MPSTYDKIATHTIPTATNSYTFTLIPSTYTDLCLIIAGTTSTLAPVKMQFNSDTATNYSRTALFGTGSSAGSVRNFNDDHIGTGTFSTSQGINKINVMNYSNTTTYKTTISRLDLSTTELSAIAGMWRSTSAISSLRIYTDGGANYAVGSTFTLYGIKAA